MKDSTMILVVAAIVAAAALPGLATSFVRVEKATAAIEHVRASAPSNTLFRLHAGTHAGKGWFSL